MVLHIKKRIVVSIRKSTIRLILVCILSCFFLLLHIWETGGTGSRINIVKRHIWKNWKARIEPLCYRKTRRYENLERRIFKGVGQFDIPQIQPVSYRGRYEWIGFNYAKSCKTGSMEKGVHFFWMITSLNAYGQILTGTSHYFIGLAMLCLQIFQPTQTIL